MRPDEHKKKKNAAYKKKHGIASNKSSNETASTAVSSDKVDKKNIGKKDRKDIQLPTPAFKGKGKSQAAPASSDEASSDNSDDVHQNAPKRKQFSRREIVSNWQKYEMEPEEEEKGKAKGEKYDVLLGMAGEAMSRFRFRDELEWEHEPSNEEHINGTGEPHSHLQLNPVDLMQSLSCIPVHQLLGVDEKLFPKDQLESILQTASANQALYAPEEATNSKENQSVPSSTPVHNSNTDEAILHTNSTNSHEEGARSISSNIQSSSNEIDSTSELKTSCRANRNAENSDCINKNPSEANPPKVSQTLGLQDDDLDRLLDMDLDQTEVTAGDSCSSQSASADGTDSTKAASKEKKTEEESEKLEEWLDSILD